jgi:hypothetical protein
MDALFFNKICGLGQNRVCRHADFQSYFVVYLSFLETVSLNFTGIWLCLSRRELLKPEQIFTSRTPFAHQKVKNLLFCT